MNIIIIGPFILLNQLVYFWVSTWKMISIAAISEYASVQYHTKSATYRKFVPPSEIIHSGIIILFNVPYDDKQNLIVSNAILSNHAINSSAHPFGWAFYTTNMRRLEIPARREEEERSAELAIASYHCHHSWRRIITDEEVLGWKRKRLKDTWTFPKT